MKGAHCPSWAPGINYSSPPPVEVCFAYLCMNISSTLTLDSSIDANWDEFTVEAIRESTDNIQILKDTLNTHPISPCCDHSLSWWSAA